MRKGLALLLLMMLQLAGATCVVEGDPIVLTVQDFGTAYFRDFTLDGGRNTAEFRNGVCLEGAADSWTVNAQSIDLTGLQPGRPISVEARQATLQLPGWYMTAERLTSDGHEFVIEGGTFEGAGMTGIVSAVTFNLDSGVIDGHDLRADGPGFRVTGQRARFENDAVTLQHAFVTTCKCPGDPLYRLQGKEALISLKDGDGEVTLYHGELQFGWLSIVLDEMFVLSNDSLSALSPPLMVEWDPASGSQSPRGRGLALVVPPFSVHEQVTFEFGLTGLDSEHPLSGFFQFLAETDDARLLTGITRGGGPIAEFSVRHRLNDQLQLTVGTNHRHYPQQSYLHEGYLTLATTFPVQNLDGGARVSWGGSVTLAASSQIRSGTNVMSPRLRSAVFADWRLPQHPAGVFSLRTDFELSYYSEARQQFGLRLRPGWNRSFGPVALALSHDLRVTDQGSPFTATLDRLTPINRTVFTARVAELEVAEDLLFNASLRFDYNWLRFAGGEHRGTEDLLFIAGLNWQAGEDSWALRPELRLQFAGLADPRAESDRLAFVEGRLNAEHGDIELGLRARYHFAGRLDGLETLELSAAYPFVIDTVKLVPFLAVDVAPLLVDSQQSMLAGHGLIIEWDSCCGLFEFGYRVHGSEFVTTLNAEFIR